jgi:PEGA domain
LARTTSCLVLVTLLGASVGHAQSADPRDDARQHYARGLELSSHGDYAPALEEFLVAYRASPNFAVLYNIGQAYVALGRPSDAAAALERYLREGKDQIPAERLARTNAQIAAQKAQSAEITVAVDAPGSSIRIDGQEVGRAPLGESLRVAPGTHVISVVAADRPEVSRSVTLQAGQHLDVQFDLSVREATPTKPTGTLRVVCSEPIQVWVDGMRVISPASNPTISLDVGQHRVALTRSGHNLPEQRVDIQPGAGVILDCAEAAPDATGSVTKAAQASSSQASTIGYVLGGLGVGLGAAAIGHYLWNRGRYENWGDVNSGLTDPNAANRHQRQLDNNELASSIDRASRVTVTLALGSGALLATGATLIVLDAGSPKKDRQSTGISVSLCGVW